MLLQNLFVCGLLSRLLFFTQGLSTRSAELEFRRIFGATGRTEERQGRAAPTAKPHTRRVFKTAD
jgi:hypothetical protein